MQSMSKAVLNHFRRIAMGVANLLAGIVVLLFGSLVAFSASQLPYKGEYGPGPGFLPLWIGIALIGCAHCNNHQGRQAGWP